MRLLGEDLVAFRDTSGQVGVLQARCPHRQAPLFYRRNEACGLRARTGGKGEFRTPITRSQSQEGSNGGSGRSLFPLSAALQSRQRHGPRKVPFSSRIP
ncbi:MAG: Rieske 2Fe-2S domain-containing protein [Candidatus Tectomicrobia bacterium]